MSVRPPKLATHMLMRFLPDELKEPVLGDLEEAFAKKAHSKSLIERRCWYWHQAFSTSFYYITQMQKVFIMLLISVLFFGLMTYLAMWLSGDVHAFFDLPSLIITLPPALLFTLGATSAGSVHRAFSVLFSGHADRAIDVKTSVRVFDILGNVSLWIGGVMTVLGWVAIGAQLDDITLLGEAFAVSVLTVLYAMIIKIMCYVASERVKHIGEMFASGTVATSGASANEG